MNRIFFAVAFAIGLMTVTWVGLGFVGSSWMALVMTAVIAGVYLLGAFELRQFRAATASLAAALADIPQPLPDIGVWLVGVPPSLQNSVRLRIEGERVALPGPALTPYLVGLLVMLGMLGTFLGMVVTFKGAVFALEGSTDLHAIRSALAAPIKGLGLAFGTSVAGVAASAMLGLLSAISRRERVDVARQLDSRIATVFRPFSLAHQRQETFKALQVQAHALPDVVDKLQTMMEGMERRSQQLNEQLLGSQAQFHREVSVAYTGLADTVGQSLKDSLTASARVAGESIKPVVEAAMTEIAQESKRLHERVSDAAQTQLTGLSAQFSATARAVSETWTTALQNHARTSESQVNGLDRALAAFTDTFEQRSGVLLATVNEAVSRSQSDQASSDRQRLQAWTQALESMAATLHGEWQRVGAQSLAQQQAVCLTLEKTAGEITERASHQASRTLDDIARLSTHSEELIRSRIDSEADWMQQHGDRMDQLASVWRTELDALREEEATRGNAAVERLGELQAALASHLATLGAALETPMTRLMQTASEVPQAAAEVIAQLRQEMTRLTERDNLALEERTGLVEQIRALLQTIHQASGEQRAAIESLVGSAAAVLDKAGSQFAETLGAQAGKAEDMAAHLTGSAVELASLGESFNHGVQLFNATNEKLIESLQRMEGTMNQSMARSDEQLAYYVAQAREVIDLSITSQQGIVEDLRQLHSKQASQSEGVAG
ncbi:DUF802 domain-containing protein [Polaromonas sp. JS666]|uniref:DUF802 domain-containing protein n=1 Tax=Polaromonas sp. (strain JS666 / ATCC BAA-500) TaxID=296591 RepID=UPI000046430E|nr:DUF802 domain-containing protein [Polaromonas sp. JS666]ABE42468.1 conserved hypothetical protein [Polaromonas sp. JS666]